MSTSNPGGERRDVGTDTLRPDPSAHVHQLRRRRHANDGDVKCVITQRDSDTGGGKSTLATWLALCWDQHGWDGTEKGTTDPEEFLTTVPELPRHSVMVLDEAEELDARRSMAQENIEFSKYWMKMRTRQVDSILTLPTASALDKRMLELAHLRLHVTRKGRCKVYDVTVDDRSGEVDERFVEFYSWPDVSDTQAFADLDASKQADLESGALSAGADIGRDELRQIIRDDDSLRAVAHKETARDEAERLRREGKSIGEIVDIIKNNPETGRPWSKSTVHNWVGDVEVADAD